MNLCWNNNNNYYYNNYNEKRLILSQEGVQQGDNLGPLIFCLTIHPALLSLKSEFLVGYMDDITIGGPVASVASDINVIIDVA